MRNDPFPDPAILHDPSPEAIAVMPEPQQREAAADIHRWASRMEMRTRDIKAFLEWKFGPDWADGFEEFLAAKLDGEPPPYDEHS